MPIALPTVPKPPPTTVQRLDASGRPTTALVTYETALEVFLKAVKAALEGL